jgi:hypothetical protein
MSVIGLLRNRTDRRIDNIPEVVISQHFTDATTLSEVISRVEELYGKPIRIEAIGDSAWKMITGLWLDCKDYGRILVRSTDPAIYQTHCILHELGHITLNHSACSAFAGEISPQKHDKHARPQAIRVRARLLEAGEQEAAAEEAAAEEIAYILAKHLIRPRTAADESVFG